MEGGIKIRTIRNVDEIMQNIRVLKGYIAGKTDPEYSWVIKRIKLGTCFIAAKGEDGKIEFYPSRFVGYAGNTMDKHDNNTEKDGRETNPAISKALGYKEKPDARMDSLYVEFCESLGFTAREKGSFGVERKYWELDGGFAREDHT